LVLRTGAIGEQIVSQPRDREVAHIHMENRSREKAHQHAREFGGQVIRWGEWDHALNLPELVGSSVSSEHPVLLRDTVKQAMAARKNRALLLMDLGVPRNIDPSLADLYNVY